MEERLTGVPLLWRVFVAIAPMLIPAFNGLVVALATVTGIRMSIPADS